MVKFSMIISGQMICMERGKMPSAGLPADVRVEQGDSAWCLPRAGLRKRRRTVAGWIGTGIPESLAVFTPTPFPPQGASVRKQGSSSGLQGGASPKLTSIHLFYLGC